MDDFWHLKGTNRPSSQWLHWPGLNQVDTGTGRYPNPYISQEVCVIERTVRQEPTFPNMLNLNSQSIHPKAGKPQAPYPLLAMLSENPQQFQSDFQQTAISRSSYLASNQSWYTGTPTNVTDAGGWPLMASGSLPFLGRAGALGTLGTSSDFPQGAQGAQGRDLNQLSRTGSAGKFDSAILRPGGLEMYKQALSVSSHLAEVELQPQYQVTPWQTDNKIQHVQSTHTEKHFPSMHRNVPQPVLEASMRLMNEQAYRKPHLRPRVFCASISGSLLGGELIVAETGRLGVMCSCHNWHMSVAKFSEHAGLFSVNPGSAVLMEGGESLAQWRRTFFSQFGVKVLDDHVGWEWDESSGPEGDHAEHREVHGQSSHKEADSFCQGDCSILKNKPSWHSSIGLGNSNPSGSRTARMGLVQGNACRLGSQNLNDIEPMNLDRPYKGIAGNDFNVNQPFLQNSYDNTTKNQEANLTRLFWGTEVGASSVAEHVNFSKFGSHPFKPVTEKASAFNGKSLQKSAGLCSLSNPAQDLAQVEKDMLTSNFELRLGQPSQHNLSLGSAYSNSFQPRLSAGTITQAKPSSYERAGQTAWEQNTQQNVDHTILGRLATFGGAMGQSKEGIYTTNWLRNDQRHGELCMSQINSERDILLGGSHQIQSCMFPDVHNAPSFPSLRKHAEDNDAAGIAGSFQSTITQQSLENRNNNEQRRAELSSLSYSTPLNAIRNDGDSQCHQQSTLLIRPTVKNSDGIRNVKDLFSTPPERPIPVMGPPEMASSNSEPMMIKSSVIQTAAVRFGACESHLTSWTKLGSCIATSEGLSSCSPTQLQEHISSTMACPMVDEVGTHQGMLVPNNGGVVEEAAQCCLGPSTADACTTLVQANECSEDSENQGFNQQKDPSKMSHDPVAELVCKKPPCIQTDSGSKCKDFTLRSREHLVENTTEQNQLQSVPNDESLVAEEKGLEGEMQKKDCNCPSLHKTESFGRVATRAFVRESKRKEVFPNDTIYKSCSTDKCCLSDEALMRSNVDAQADSAGVEAMTQESPSSFKCPSARHDKLPFNAGSENPKMEEKRSRRTICGRDDSGAKELIRNDVLDEGSGIGKCCSSIEADMEAMTSVGPVSSHAYAQVLESQTSMANSSSSNAVISDTLSNSVRVRKLFLEADKTARETQEVGQPNQKTDKKGRKALKWKCLEVTSVEGVGQGKFSRVEDKSAVVALRKALVSADSTCRIPTVKSLKRKRSLPSFGPDLKTLRFRTVFNEGITLDVNDAELTVKRKGPKPAVKPTEETSAKQVVKTNILNTEKLTGRSKRIKYQDLTSPTCMPKASSSLKASLASGKEKVKNTTISGLSSSKTGRSTAERQDFKAVKMVSLSSILEFPKAGAGFKGKRGIDTHCDSFSKLLGANGSEVKARQTKGLPFGRTLSVLVHPKESVNDHGLNRKEGRKRSLWEMAAKSMHHATDIPVAYAKDTKHISFALRQSCQNKTSASQMMVHVEKRAIGFRTSEFQGKMVSVPIKFIAEKRLATEDLQKETKGLLVDVVNHSNPSGRLVKRLRSQGAHAKMGSYGHILHSDSKGSMLTLEQHEVRQTKKRRKRKRRSKSFNARSKNKQPMACCICGESSVKSNNVLVKCTRCGLAAHQACYGVTEVTKKSWICRPCKAHATNIVCVLCGYGEGAMTRAKKSEALAKGLLQAWQEEDDKNESTRFEPNLCSKSTALDAVLPSGSSTIGCECKNGQYDCKVHGMLKKDEGVSGIVQEEPKACRKEGLNAVNSVSSAVNDPKVTQWVHVVCALWMPGTRCVNVSTMAAFDVSGVPIARRKWVCSICKRPGGACIKCRVTKCATPFHPWCAHGKGLLQNEAFGGEEEKVGFFGRCLLHGQTTDEGCEKVHIEGFLPKAAGSKNDNSTCARTEGGYRRGDTSFELKKTDSVSLGVSQEEVAAWLSIKEPKRSTRRFIKLANSDIKTHHREYVRYKQEQGWKRLAVYKSNIHALGLYTSDPIAKGEMVVEYVGEVVGLRVADKREADYLSSGRLQYRGACYLFRIDKEHIIDATHKGGIARFVNHSCLPNCVAKIICVEKQKKVVFFAEKNIAAGEELTYDYKLDFENDNRIPCYCKSAQCRGYLN